MNKLTLALVMALFCVCFTSHSHAASGDFDLTFGTNGKIAEFFMPPPSGYVQPSWLARMALQPDGKIVVAGSAYLIDENGKQPKHRNIRSVATLTRYNADGTVDGSFAGGGKLFFDNPPFTDSIYWDLAVQADGKIVVVGGTTMAVSPGSNTGALRPLAMRFNADGTLDTGFAHNGYFIDFTQQFRVNMGVAIDAQGRILVGGPKMVRLNPDGSQDFTFIDGTQSLFAGGLGRGIRRLIVQPDGKILMGGHGISSDYRNLAFVARLNQNGTPDLTFNQTGMVEAQAPATYREGIVGLDVTLSPDNKIVLAGYKHVYNAALAPECTTQTSSPDCYEDHPFIARYEADGSVDTNFASPVDSLKLGWLTGVKVQADNKIVTVGGYYQMKVARFLTSGELDTSFQGGVVTVAFGEFGSGEDVLIDSQGAILAGGVVNPTVPNVEHPEYAQGIARILP
jgi:uncharacterized delta-60 repeat protein